MQFASTPESGVIVALSCETVGSDRGLAEPMAQAIERAYGHRPKRHLLDGGFLAGADIDAAAASGGAIYCPPTKSKSRRDPFLPRSDDSPAVAEWRARMASQEGKAVYKRRSRCERINAVLRNRGLDRLHVRGRDKVLAAMRWFALAFNILAERRLNAA